MAQPRRAGPTPGARERRPGVFRDLRWIRSLSEPIPELCQAFPGLGAVTLYCRQDKSHVEGRACMVACRARSPGVTPEETMVRRARLSPQTEGGPLVTLMDRNVAHPRTHSYSSHTLGANNAPSHGRRRAAPWTGVCGGWGWRSPSRTGCSVPAHPMCPPPSIKCPRRCMIHEPGAGPEGSSSITGPSVPLRPCPAGELQASTL